MDIVRRICVRLDLLVIVGDMSKQKSRGKMCDRCNNLAEILYRVQVDVSRDWIFVCQGCWQLASENNPHYVYGGTWKKRQKNR